MPPTLIIVTGLPATGKTTIARYLSLQLLIPVFHKDDIKELLFDQLTAEVQTSSSLLGRTSFALLELTAQRMLEAGNSVIIEGNYSQASYTDQLVRLAINFQADLIQVWCNCEEVVRQQRFVDRHSSRHPTHAQNGPSSKGTGSQQSLSMPGLLIEVDTTDWEKVDLADIADQVQRHLTSKT